MSYVRTNLKPGNTDIYERRINGNIKRLYIRGQAYSPLFGENGYNGPGMHGKWMAGNLKTFKSTK